MLSYSQRRLAYWTKGSRLPNPFRLNPAWGTQLQEQDTETMNRATSRGCL
uniref:Uncharacterized protein n=1 Tax=Lotus japonicus TaxID=34305 RepID=I3T0P2_LOTJA|nr:unknown [Lotus japonicus]